MKRSIKSRQRDVEIIAFTFDGVSNANTFGGLDKDIVTLGSLGDIGAGNYQFDLGIPLQNAVVQITSETDNIEAVVDTVTAPASGANTLLEIAAVDNDGTPTATDLKVHIVVIGSMVSDTYSA
jgi:hypothetical protein